MTKGPVDGWDAANQAASNGGVYMYDEIHMSPMPEKAPPYDTVIGGPEVDTGSVSTDSEFTSNSLVSRAQRTTSAFFAEYSSSISNLIKLIFLIAYGVYFGFALSYSVPGATALIVGTAFGAFIVVYSWIKKHYGRTIWKKILKPIYVWLLRVWPTLQWIIVPLLGVALICYIVFYVIKDLEQLQSLSGCVVFVAFLYCTCRYPDKIMWRPVVVGFGLQILFGILVLRWKPGYDAIKWLSDQIMTFINYSLEGASIVFGDPTMLFHPFVFVIMPMLIYIGAVMSMLYYWGITQVVAAKMGWGMQMLLQTTAIETLAIAANIFLNGMDTMLMLRHYLPKLTRSEFHCFLVGNHATVAGFAFATFVMFGAPPQYLISASVMSAPATIAVAKLNYPETEESVTKTQQDVKLEKGDETNFIEAGANGATVAGKTVTAVVVNYIGFLGMLGFINATLLWIGERVGFDELSFEWVCSYLFWPLSILMGVNPGEAREVAKLVGLKVFTSEMLAYQELGVSINNGLSERSASIATYALCGFSSLSTLAIAVGVWNTVCPVKTQEMAGQLPRVIVNANISCFLTACMAALMFDPSIAGESESKSELVNKIMELLPTYKNLMGIIGM